MSSLHTPILLLVFNRPGITQRTFETIRQARPLRLYVACDGPRSNSPDDAEKVQKVHQITTNVDWECDLKTHFLSHNMGCSHAVSNAISWFFENEEQGIILEDDCLPSRTFFGFAETLLNLYKDDPRIAMITGYNSMGERLSAQHDYIFSCCGGIWGWASWRRAWQHFDSTMEGFNEFISSDLLESQMGRRLSKRRRKILIDAFRKISLKEIDSWAYPWAYARHKHQSLTCVPTVNLIENIGFGSDATHLKAIRSRHDSYRREILLPLRFNESVIPDLIYDEHFLGVRSLRKKLLSILHRLTLR